IGLSTFPAPGLRFCAGGSSGLDSPGRRVPPGSMPISFVISRLVAIGADRGGGEVSTGASAGAAAGLGAAFGTIGLGGGGLGGSGLVLGCGLLSWAIATVVARRSFLSWATLSAAHAITACSASEAAIVSPRVVIPPPSR